MQVRAEAVVDGADLDAVHGLYLRSMAPLVTRAAARHVLTPAEFAEEMADRRITKLVVRDDAGEASALMTFTRDLAAVPWVNPSYFRTRFPDVAGRDALFYLGYVVVDPGRRRSQALLLMAVELRRRLEAAQGVLAFDICAYNDDHGIGRWAAWLCGPKSSVTAVDTQTYSVADYRHGRIAADPVVRQPLAADELRVITLAERPDLVDEVTAVLAMRWPAFMLAGHPGHDEDLMDLLQAAPDHQVVAVDPGGRVRGAGFSLPITWDGTDADLPAGWDDAVSRAAALRRSGGSPDAVVALSVTVAADAVRRGLAVQLIEALRTAAAQAGGRALVAPVRPVLKERYPLVDLTDYLTWRTPDDQPFDPWVRTHLRLGARVAEVAPASMTITGSVADWRVWTEDPLPGPGTYVVPGALAPLVVADGVGTYVEPNVWLVHGVPSAA